MQTRPKYRVEILGPEVTKRRLALALTRKQLAERSGLSLHRINKIESGGGWRGVSPESVQALCGVFGCDPLDISEVAEVQAS